MVGLHTHTAIDELWCRQKKEMQDKTRRDGEEGLKLYVALSDELWGTCPAIIAVMSGPKDEWYPRHS